MQFLRVRALSLMQFKRVRTLTDGRSQYNLELNLRHCIANYGPILSSERAPYMKNKESNCHSNKYNIWSPASREARHQEELAD
jgi:hypothetical protein